METNKKIEGLIEKKTKSLKRRKPHLETIELSYQEEKRGFFKTQVKAKTKYDIFILNQVHNCLDTSIKRTFSKLNKLLAKRKTKKPKRVELSLLEA